ncbi:MAG: GNAT family N-acetyltransferase [Oscillospiraceae bacterium]
MIIPETAVTLKDGTKVILRSPQRRDAAQLNEYLRLTSGETHYMVRYPEECDRTLEAAQKRLWAVTDHERSFMLAAFLDGELVGNCGINAMSDHFKCATAPVSAFPSRKSVGAGARQTSDGKGAGAGEGKRLYAGGAGGVCRQ